MSHETKILTMLESVVQGQANLEAKFENLENKFDILEHKVETLRRESNVNFAELRAQNRAILVTMDDDYNLLKIIEKKVDGLTTTVAKHEQDIQELKNLA